MRDLHIIMPMAGEGSRFKEAGYDVPKPLIKVEGKELYRHALDSVYFQKSYYKVNIKYTFIVRSEFIKEYNIETNIRKYYPNANIISIDHTTRGALETIMLAKDFIDDNDYVISIDCDIKFDCKLYLKYIYNHCLYDSEKPMVLVFYSKSPIYSYIHSKDGFFGDYLVEKDPISTYAIGGCYVLGSGKKLKIAAEQYINDFELGKIKSKELYLSGVYNYIIKIDDSLIEMCELNMHKDRYWSFGTPYDLEHYNYDRMIWDK